MKLHTRITHRRFLDKFLAPKHSPEPSRMVVRTHAEHPVLTELSPLMPDEVRSRLPRLYATKDDADPIVQVRYRAWRHCDWNIIEFDGTDILFGMVWYTFPIWGYFRLSDLQTMNNWACQPAIVIDRDFDPKPATQAMWDYRYDF